ncbi:diguanylate cyclase domain-containing protein [Microbaculum marinisediminis]|uniref:Diguanylate cyclase n=1 Tax=Microbaculum marinisediminis TaxID=2931392 RepID=A0AAW5QYP7_9HYPH|nr:diguanylate cyclase [Microbaculum sp. A6E488]MCT8973176.1 diguanylate cyclase [Microbaculum sp. A6E488]
MGAGRHTIDLTVSIGVAALEHPDDTPERLLKRADHALYAAKKTAAIALRQDRHKTPNEKFRDPPDENAVRSLP